MYALGHFFLLAFENQIFTKPTQYDIIIIII